MAIEHITYAADMVHTDDSNKETGKYLAWAKEEIERKYPEANIKVVEYALPSHVVMTDEREGADNEKLGCTLFLNNLWRRYAMAS